MASPMHRSKGCRLGMGSPHAAPIEVKKPSSFVEMSVPAAMRHASPMLVQNLKCDPNQKDLPYR